MTGHGTPEDRFWARQRGAAETIGVGRRLIAQVSLSSGHVSILALVANSAKQGAAMKVNKKDQ